MGGSSGLRSPTTTRTRTATTVMNVLAGPGDRPRPWRVLVKAIASSRSATAPHVDAYEADLETRGGRKYNATQLRLHLTAALKSKAVALLAERELRDWRAGLVKKGLKPSSADRIGRAFKAALALAARNDQHITNTAAWKNGLKKLPDSEVARNVILPDQTVAALVGGSYDEDRGLRRADRCSGRDRRARRVRCSS